MERSTDCDRQYDDRMLHVEITDSIRAFPDMEWDGLAGDDIMSSYGWLRTVEETYTGGMTPVYLAVRQNGRMVAATVAYRIVRPKTNSNLDSVLFGRHASLARTLGLTFMPVLECAPYRNYGKHFLMDERLDASHCHHAMYALLSAMEHYAVGNNMALCFNRVMDTEHQLMVLLGANGYHQTLTFPTNYLDIHWKDFTGYVNAVRKESLNNKKNIKKEINRLKRAGVVIEEMKRLGGDEPRLFELLELNCRKHNQHPLPFKNGFLKKLKQRLGDELSIYISRKQGNITGVSLMFRRGHEAFLSMVGVDYTLARNDGTYFNLTFYPPIEEATRAGVRRLHLGNGQYQTKQRRGCKTSPCYLYYKSFQAARNCVAALYFPLHRAWYRKKQVPSNLQTFLAPPGSQP
jgi:predicted N-acyltransferase